VFLNKNILFVSLYPPHQRGGGEIQTHKLVNSLKRKKFNPFILSMSDKKFFEKYSENGIKVYRVDKFQKSRREKFSILQGIRYSTFEIFNPFIFLFTIYLILKHKIKVVHISTFNQISLAPLIAAKLLLRKVIVTLHSHELLCFFSVIFFDCYGIKKGECGNCILRRHEVPSIFKNNNLLRKILIGILNYQIRYILFLKMKIVNLLADKITFPSEYLRKIYVKYGIQNEKTLTIHNFMQFPKIDKLKINRLKRILKIDDEKIILFMGSTTDEKGIKVLLKAFEIVSKKIRDLKLILAGGNYFYEKTKNIEVNSNLINKVIIAGWIKEDDKPYYYYISHIVAIPSLVHETFSLVFLEASLTSKIIIASDIGALSDEIIDGENGFLVEPNNPERLAKKIEYVLKNYEKLDPVRERAFLNAKEKYEPNRMINEFMKLYS
jgi:glycosyltransferase involved in cell wall biosynthesis